MPTWVGEAEAMIRFARLIGIVSPKGSKPKQTKPKKTKKPSHPRGMP